jgi:hypothetical protein
VRILLSRSRRQGSATLVAFVLVTVMCALALANIRVLDHLDRELQHLNQQQKKKFVRPPAAPKPGQPQAGEIRRRTEPALSVQAH